MNEHDHHQCRNSQELTVLSTVGAPPPYRRDVCVLGLRWKTLYVPRPAVSSICWRALCVILVLMAPLKCALCTLVDVGTLKMTKCGKFGPTMRVWSGIGKLTGNLSGSSAWTATKSFGHWICGRITTGAPGVVGALPSGMASRIPGPGCQRASLGWLAGLGWRLPTGSSS